MYDYLLIGSGLFNAVFAYEAAKKAKKCLVVEKRDHIGGNCYTSVQKDIVVHKYGAHIFRTNDKYVWDYMNEFAEFNNFVNSPLAVYQDELYNLPFNMNTFSKLWNIRTPDEAKAIIEEQGKIIDHEPRNLEEHAIRSVGTDIYEKLIKGYTEKQWGKKCTELPPSIMRRIPLRFVYDNNYFNDRYQGIPIGGYTPIIEKMFSACTIVTGMDYLADKNKWNKEAKCVVYTGTIDSFFDYKYGDLEYRSLKFEEEYLDTDNFQGNAVINYTSADIPYTRVIEHKHFVFGKQPNTIISKEYPIPWNRNIEPYYPINDEANGKIYEQYKAEADKLDNVFFGGRLGEYKYYDMQDTIKSALNFSESVL